MSKRSRDNMYAVKLWLEWAQYDSYKEIATLLGTDVSTLMNTCVTQGMSQLAEQINEIITSKENASEMSNDNN